MSACAPCGPGGLSRGPRFRPSLQPGAFASWNSRFQALAGAGALVAGPSPGVGVGLFSWAGVDGLVRNARLASTDRLGFCLPPQKPLGAHWQATYWDKDARVWRIRTGLGCVLASAGEFYARFDLGATAGQPVYTDPATGFAYSGASLGLELTPYVVAVSGAPGGTAPISTWSVFS